MKKVNRQQMGIGGKRIWALLSVFFLAGCSAHMIETRGDAVSLFDRDAQKKGGVIRYLNRGLSSWRNARRANAEKQMQTFCSGPYTILAEGPRSQWGGDMPTGKSVTFEVDEYTYVAFECVRSKSM